MTTYAIKFVVEDAAPLDLEPCKKITVSFAESERSAYRFIQAGSLGLPAVVWEYLLQAIARGARRPLLAILEDGGPSLVISTMDTTP